MLRKRRSSPSPPTRMTLPDCLIGGLRSISRIRSAAFPENHDQPARIRPVTLTVSPAPGTIRMLPEPDRTSRFTGPVTWSVRSKDPSRDWADAGDADARATAPARAAAATTAFPNPRRACRIMCSPPGGHTGRYG